MMQSPETYDLKIKEFIQKTNRARKFIEKLQVRQRALKVMLQDYQQLVQVTRAHHFRQKASLESQLTGLFENKSALVQVAVMMHQCIQEARKLIKKGEKARAFMKVQECLNNVELDQVPFQQRRDLTDLMQQGLQQKLMDQMRKELVLQEQQQENETID
jgi:hypothetical protein